MKTTVNKTLTALLAAFGVLALAGCNSSQDDSIGSPDRSSMQLPADPAPMPSASPPPADLAPPIDPAKSAPADGVNPDIPPAMPVEPAPDSKSQTGETSKVP